MREKAKIVVASVRKMPRTNEWLFCGGWGTGYTEEEHPRRREWWHRPAAGAGPNPCGGTVSPGGGFTGAARPHL